MIDPAHQGASVFGFQEDQFRFPLEQVLLGAFPLFRIFFQHHVGVDAAESKGIDACPARENKLPDDKAEVNSPSPATGTASRIGHVACGPVNWPT